VIAIILINALPESVRFLTVRGKDAREISRIMRKIASDISTAELNLSPPAAAAREQRNEGLPVRHLFTEGRAAGTILLWIPFFMNLLILYFIVNWLPVLLRPSGLVVSEGVIAVSLFSLGGITGALTEGRVMNSFGAYATLLAQFAISALLIGHDDGHICARRGHSRRAGGSERTSRRFLSYDCALKGVGWALGVGRVGSIVGPAIGGMLLTMGWTPQRIFLAEMAPALYASIAILGSSRLRGQASAFRAELDVRRA